VDIRTAIVRGEHDNDIVAEQSLRRLGQIANALREREDETGACKNAKQEERL
jgi:hypothetical protein